jgi:hypothetical protein
VKRLPSPTESDLVKLIRSAAALDVEHRRLLLATSGALLKAQRGMRRRALRNALRHVVA